MGKIFLSCSLNLTYVCVVQFGIATEGKIVIDYITHKIAFLMFKNY